MSKKLIPRSVYEITQALNQQLIELESELSKVVSSELSLKLVVTILRNLICDQKKRSGRQIGLLWRVTKKLKISNMVTVDDSYMIPKLGGIVNSPKIYIFPLKMPSPEFRIKSRHCLHEITQNWHAIYILGKKITYQKLIKDLSQQMGIAHENDEIDEYLFLLDKTRLHNYPIYAYAIYSMAKFVLKLGKKVIKFAENQYGYTKINDAYKDLTGDFSIMVRLGIKNPILSDIKVIEFFLNISELKVTLLIKPKGIRFKIEKYGDIDHDFPSGKQKKEALTKVYFLDLSYPKQLKFYEDFVCTMSYSAKRKQVRVTINEDSSEVFEIDIGQVTLDDIKPKPNKNNQNFYLQYILSFKGICNSKNIKGLLNKTPEDDLLCNIMEKYKNQDPFAPLS